RTGNDTHPEYKTRNEYRQRPVAREKSLSALESRFLNAKNGLTAPQQWTAAVISQRKSQVVAECRAYRSHDDDSGQPQVMLRVGKKAGQQQNRLARNRDA